MRVLLSAILLMMPSALMAQEALCSADRSLRLEAPLELQSRSDEIVLLLTLDLDEPRATTGLCRDVAGGLDCRLGGSGTPFQVIDRGRGPQVEVGADGLGFRTEADAIVWGQGGRAELLRPCP